MVHIDSFVEKNKIQEGRSEVRTESSPSLTDSESGERRDSGVLSRPWGWCPQRRRRALSDWPRCVRDGGDSDLGGHGGERRGGQAFSELGTFLDFLLSLPSSSFGLCLVYCPLRVVQHVTSQSPRKVGPGVRKLPEHSPRRDSCLQGQLGPEPVDAALIPEVSWDAPGLMQHLL